MSGPVDHVPTSAAAPAPTVALEALAAAPPIVAEPGTSTTEFWGKTVVQVITLGFALVTAYQQKNADVFLASAIGIVAALEGVYAVARSIRKSGTAG